MKYLKSIIFFFSFLLISNVIITILYYFNITSSSFNNILKIIIFILSFISVGISIGKKANKKGWLEGLKIAGILVAFFLITSLILRYDFNIKQILYYIICILTIVLGSMIGINFKKNNK